MTQPESQLSATPTDIESSFTAAMASTANPSRDSLFSQHLMDHLRVGVVFVDAYGRIETWNRVIEVLTGLRSSCVLGTEISSEMFKLAHAEGAPVEKQECPFAIALQTGKIIQGEYKVSGLSGREIKADVKVVPVATPDSTVLGAVVTVHDTSMQQALQRRLEDLYAMSMLDSLTHVANRAEFERVLTEYVKAHHVTSTPCSLIVCDIDFFKQINDNFGHHVGDQALVAFAELLKKFTRQNDFVARFGGEEFVILCANCNAEAAMERAEKIRVALATTPQQMLQGKCLNASFGVSELQPNDIETDFFVRADKALLMAKETGRNRVVDASAMENEKEFVETEEKSLAGIEWRKINSKFISCDEFQTTTPISVLIEKLRGYIMEQDAEINEVEHHHASFKLTVADCSNPNRKGVFCVDVEVQEGETVGEEFRKTSYIRLTIMPAKTGWFSNNAVELAPQVVKEFRRFFLLSDDTAKVEVTPAATQPGKR